MKGGLKPPSRSLPIVRLLWKAARQRSRGRARRNQELLQNKSQSRSDGIQLLITIFSYLGMALMHAILGWFLVAAVELTETVAARNDNVVLISSYSDEILHEIVDLEAKLTAAREEQSNNVSDLEGDLRKEVERLGSRNRYHVTRYANVDRDEVEQWIIDHYQSFGAAGFRSRDEAGSLKSPETLSASYWLVAGLILVWWILLLICQGEGLEVDIQRSRFPIWEWLFSHPIRSRTAFAGEFLGPWMANPFYSMAPVFWFVIFADLYDGLAPLIGAIAVGVPLALAGSALNKSIEVSCLLRIPSHSRGLILGLISWFGFVGMLAPVFLVRMESVKIALVECLQPLTRHEFLWRPAELLLTGWSSPPTLWQTILVSWGLCQILLIATLCIVRWGTAKGLQSSNESRKIKRRTRNSFFLGSPYFWKEILWLRRDKSAVIQVFLIPLTMASFQAINLGGLAELATKSWSLFCGVGILCGTYFLLVIGPRSLSSEGGALWIAQTWPRSLEELLQAKARLWWGFASLVVFAIFSFAGYLFPEALPQIFLTTAAWLVFSRSLATKAVTLVTAPSSSGEPEPPPKGRMFAAYIGTLAFGIGVLTKNWHLATIGVVFSSITSAAMWQNLRARLPYLFDRWSEKLPPAPSLMHCMIATAIVVEIVGIISAVAGVLGGPEVLWIARPIAYGLVSMIAFLILHEFLVARDVSPTKLWYWSREKRNIDLRGICVAIAAAVILSGVAYLYLQILEAIPATAAYMEELKESRWNSEYALPWQFILAVALAPIAEEYLFRALLFRSLCREWSFWKATIGSAAFFAIYHPPVAWLPVFFLGLINAILFRKTGHLFPCVLTHMVYNAIVLFF